MKKKPREKWYTVTFEISKTNLNNMANDTMFKEDQPDRKTALDRVREIIYASMPGKIAIRDVFEGTWEPCDGPNDY